VQALDAPAEVLADSAQERLVRCAGVWQTQGVRAGNPAHRSYAQRVEVFVPTRLAKRAGRSGRRIESFTTAQAGKVLGVSPALVRSWVRICRLGVRTSNRRILLSFQDIAFLRQAFHLRDRFRKRSDLQAALRALRAQVFGEGGARGRIRPRNGGLVCEDDGSSWDYATGQLFLPFPEQTQGPASNRNRIASLADHRAQRTTGDAEEDPAGRWYFLGVAREEAGDLVGARQAYLNALKCDAELSDACVNLGRLAHYEGRVQRAAFWYRRALSIAPEDPIAHYNLAIALEDLGDLAGAVREYQAALQCDWEFPEAHFNLSRIFRLMGHQLAAMRHLKIYRQLTGPKR
jgi:tetratricopeptide (TPR) repeat protein